MDFYYYKFEFSHPYKSNLSKRFQFLIKNGSMVKILNEFYSHLLCT